MALIKNAEARELVRDAVVLDLGDLRAQGERIIEEARRQAGEIVKAAQAERERLIAGAAEQGRREGYETGFKQGEAAGREAGRTRALKEHGAALGELEQKWGAALQSFAGERERVLRGAKEDVLRLVAMIAERVIKRAVELDETVVAAQMEAVLGLVLRPTGLVIAVNPADRAVAGEALPALLQRIGASPEHVELAEDAGLARGSCVVRGRGEAAGSELDASIDTQLGRILDALLPGGARDDGGRA